MERIKRTETNEMIRDLRGINVDVRSAAMPDCTYLLGQDFFQEVADRLEELQESVENWENIDEGHYQTREKMKAKIKFLEKQLAESKESQNELNLSRSESESRSAWNSFEYETEVASNMEIIYLTQDQFPRLVVVTNENGKATHWMQLNAPKPKEPTFKDKLLEAFPKADSSSIDVFNVFPWVCKKCNFTDDNGYVDDDICRYQCWEQPYFEPEEEGEGDA